jgi:hypothetical protein
MALVPSRTDVEPTTSWVPLELAPAVPPLLLRQTTLALRFSHTGSPVPLIGSAESGLTSAPTRVASPTPLITLHKANSADAASLDASFRKSLSTTKRVIALSNNSLFAGFYVVTPHKRIRPIFQPQRCTLTDPNTGVEQEFLVGHGSNDPRFLRTEYVPVDVAGTFVCLVDTSSSEVPACFRSGPAFTAADITGTHTLTLKEDATYKAVHLPLALPIPFGIDDTAKGTITEATQDILDTTISDGAFWATCILAYDKANTDELVHHTTDGIGKIGNRLILPRLLAGQSWGYPPTCKVSAVGDDEEDEAKPAIDALTSRLLEITDLPARTSGAPATVATDPRDLDGLDLDSIATMPIPRRPGAPGIELASKEVPLNDRLRDRAKLANLGWDRASNTIHLPTLTENGEWLYRSPDRASINEAMANMFANIPEALASSTDFLHREVDLPHHDPLVYAQYATSYYETSSMQSIELTGESKKRFRYFYLVPDSKSLAEERESASYDREAEELLGESKENLSKVKTTITTSTAISNVNHLRAYLANICAVIETQFACDLALVDIHTPAMFIVARTIALHLSSSSMRAHLKKSNRPHKPLVLWTVQMLDQLSILITHPLRHTKNTFLLASGKLHEIASDKFTEAFELLDDCVSTLRKFECGTGTIPSCPLLMADEAKTARSKIDKAPKRPVGPDSSAMGLTSLDAKRQRSGKPADITPSADDLSGTLIYTGSDMMPSVNEANPAMRLCAARQRVGRNCPRGSTCKMIHDLDITKWPDATFAKWSALVDQTPGLDWNRKVVDPVRVSARMSKLASSSLSSATAAKAKS